MSDVYYSFSLSIFLERQPANLWEIYTIIGQLWLWEKILHYAEICLLVISRTFLCLGALVCPRCLPSQFLPSAYSICQCLSYSVTCRRRQGDNPAVVWSVQGPSGVGLVFFDLFSILLLIEPQRCLAFLAAAFLRLRQWKPQAFLFFRLTTVKPGVFHLLFM